MHFWLLFGALGILVNRANLTGVYDSAQWATGIIGEHDNHTPHIGAAGRGKYNGLNGFDCSLGTARYPFDALLRCNLQYYSHVLSNLSRYALGACMYTSYASVACLPPFNASNACLPMSNASVACPSTSDASFACSPVSHAAVAYVVPTYFDTSPESCDKYIMRMCILPSHKTYTRKCTAELCHVRIDNVADSSYSKGCTVTLHCFSQSARRYSKLRLLYDWNL